MNKKFTLVLALLFCVIAGFSKPISQTTAEQIARNFAMSHQSDFGITNSRSNFIKETFVEKHNSIAVLYIMNYNPTGYIIISADDVMYPVLAYSYESNYNPANIAPAFQEFLTGYKNEIIKRKSSKQAVDIQTGTAWREYLNGQSKGGDVKGISPLITSKWNQDEPYNDSCPPHASGPNGRCLTGCVATMMGQIMYYFKYPLQGSGSHSYYHPHFMTLSADYGSTTYNWSMMSNVANTNSKPYIAQLLRHCGVAVDMNYTPTASGADFEVSMDAFKSYFGFSTRCRFYEKGAYPDSIWDMMLRDNLEKKIPVPYRGTGTAGGHAFICDGYQGLNHFHFNWGWGGASDGYFYLDNIDFSFGQAALFDMTPYDYPYCQNNRTYTETERYITDGSAYSKYWNNTDCEWLISPANNQPITLTFSNFSTQAGKDILYIYDGNSTTSPLIGAYSGNSGVPVITSTGGKLLLVWKTDSTINEQGWDAFYTAVPLSVNEMPAQHDFTIFPNPAQNTLNIEFGETISNDLNISVLNYSGQTIIEKKIAASQHLNLDITGLSSGVYVLRIVDKSGISNRKFIVK